MSTSADPETGLDDDERVIDRSGDIDQRPPEERNGNESANAVGFPVPARRTTEPPHAVQRYVPAPPPSARFQPPPPGLEDIARHLQKDLDKHYAKAKAQLDALAQKIEAQEKRCQPPKLDGDLQQIRFQRQKVLIANGPLLADRLREEKSRLADLETFKAENRLVRDAHYPSSPVLAFGILSSLILVEAGINGVLFADSSDQGLFGGWLEALVLAIANVGAAFLLGRIVLPQLHRRGFLPKIGAVVLCLTGAAALIAVNLTGAHYRDFKAATASSEPAAPIAPKPEPASAVPGTRKPASEAAFPRKTPKPALAVLPPPPPPALTVDREKAKESDAIAKAVQNPFAFDSFMSVFLFVIGLCGAAIAALDGYKFDDPFPGFGKRHRKYAAARVQSTEALRRILSQSNAIMTGSFQAIGRKIEAFAQEMAVLLTLHHAYAGDLKALQDSLEEAGRDAEAQISLHDRLANKVPMLEPRDFYAVAVKQLPPLGEKQVKFYETQDKKLKALQKSATKEQNDVLGVFEAASEDFQKLLAEASQASLQAALVQTPETPGGTSA
ncbi:MAG: hypothetical protein ACLPPF_14525 [Rhodomicrobium sp.]